MGHNRFRNRVLPGEINEGDLSKIREAVCITVDKIYDSCRDKDCVLNAEVIFKHPEKIQRLLERAINVKIRKAEIQDVYTDVEEVPFKRGFYTVDIKYFIRVTLDIFVPCRSGGVKIKTVHGLITYDKKVILFGSDGSVRVFKSKYNADGIDDEMGTELEQDNLPIAQVEVADPIALTAKIVDERDEKKCCKFEQLPSKVCRKFERYSYDDSDDDIDMDIVAGARVEGDPDDLAVLVSVGVFSIVKLIRKVQLLVPAFGFCVPNNECVEATQDNPCDIFDTLDFPNDEFFPPQLFEFVAGEEDEGRDRKDKKDC